MNCARELADVYFLLGLVTCGLGFLCYNFYTAMMASERELDALINGLDEDLGEDKP